MPQVPQYGNLRVGADAGAAPAFQGGVNDAAMIGARQLGQAGEALGQAGGVAAKIATDMQREANELRVNDAMNQYIRAQTDARVEVLKFKGKDALERPDGKNLPDEFSERLDATTRKIAEGLGNDAQRSAFSGHAARATAQFRGVVTQHMVAQQEVYADQTDKAALDTATHRGTLLWGDKEALDGSKATITRAVDAIAKRKGFSPEARDMALLDAMSPLHMGVMKGMITAGQANAAKAYYEENSAGMSMQARAQMQGVVKQASDVQTGDAAADAAWSASGPQGANDAVKLFDLEKTVRAQLKDNPDAAKHAIDGLRQRAQAFNAQQAETNAAGINSVYALIDGGKPLSVVMRSEAWMGLPAIKQHEIARSLENEAHARESRALTAENRQALAGQKQDRALLFQNGDAYLRYSDPEVLKDMTRTQVEATRTVFGMEGTQHLLARFDALQRPGAIGEAKMDKQDFDFLAKRMGLDPLSKNKDERDRVGDAQFRIEQLILRAQTAKKAPLTREEKMGLVSVELAQTVQINPMFGARRDASVLSIQPDQIKQVVVPGAERSTLAGEMARLYAENNDPRYAPTNDNLKRYYLRKKSPAADLIGSK